MANFDPRYILYYYYYYYYYLCLTLLVVFKCSSSHSYILLTYLLTYLRAGLSNATHTRNPQFGSAGLMLAKFQDFQM